MSENIVVQEEGDGWAETRKRDSEGERKWMAGRGSLSMEDTDSEETWARLEPHDGMQAVSAETMSDGDEKGDRKTIKFEAEHEDSDDPESPPPKLRHRLTRPDQNDKPPKDEDFATPIPCEDPVAILRALHSDLKGDFAPMKASYTAPHRSTIPTFAGLRDKLRDTERAVRGVTAENKRLRREVKRLETYVGKMEREDGVFKEKLQRALGVAETNKARAKR